MNEEFIKTLFDLHTKYYPQKIFVFNIVRRKGKLYYSIEYDRYDYSGNITKEDIMFLKEYFIDNGYEVDDKYSEYYLNTTLGGKVSVMGIYIKGRK